ncbi:MAG TPA: hypothetical protein VK982_10065, partial [Bacteroidales bacterium]|nr:hypothetical protein [Bacteroidales bacterium]
MTKEKKETDINKEKLKALQLTLDKIDKDYGKGTIMKMGDKAIADVPSISSGSISLDMALGVGGFPRGRARRRLRLFPADQVTLSECMWGTAKVQHRTSTTPRWP